MVDVVGMEISAGGAIACSSLGGRDCSGTSFTLTGSQLWS